MTNFNTELITALSQGINIDEIFRKQLEDSMNMLLETQTTAFLGYEPYDVSAYNNANSRNGYYHRNFKSEFGELILKIPRDRQGTFSQKTIESFKDANDTLQDTIKLFYQNGLTKMRSSQYFGYIGFLYQLSISGDLFILNKL